VRHCLAFVFLGLLSLAARAELTIEITRGVDNPTKIAVVPMELSGSDALPENISQIVNADLERSGQFATIPQRDMLSFPRREQDVYFRDWRVLDAEYLLIGNLESVEGRLRVNYELFDVINQRKVLRRQQVEGRESQLRAMAHHISDKVYEAITGIPGAFSTEIIYVEALPNGEPGSQFSETFRLMLADADGRNPRMLLQSDDPILSPSWSPDGGQVAYVSFETSRPAIFLQDLETGQREQLTDFRGLNGAPAWSPDGKKLALVLSKDGNPEIYTLNLESGRFTRITNHFAIDTEPNWTGDGEGIIFTSNRGGKPQIYQVTLASGRVERLTFTGDYNARPRISPDGKTMVMVHQRNDVFHIAAQDLETGTLRILTETHLDESPSIAPNGAMLMYATRRGDKGVLAVVSLDAGTRYFLPSEQGNVREPAWSPYFD